MILLCAVWLHSNACQNLFCTQNIHSKTIIQSEQLNADQLFKQFQEVVSQYDKSKPLDVVVIDPGHGGRDKGCSGASSIEKVITLQISKRLKTLIQEQMPEVKVLLTRSVDKFVSLKTRATIANTNEADIFISVHCNYLRNAAKFRGSETFILGTDSDNSASEQLAIRENESIALEDSYLDHYDGFDPLSPESYILFSMIQNLYLDNSIVLAQLVDSEIAQITEVPSHGVKQGAFVVLKETKMPSILVETGYLSNADDEALLTSSDGQSHVVTALLNAIKAYRHSLK